MREARQSAVAAPERSLGLAGSIIKGRYRVNALLSVRPDVVVYRAEDVRSGRSIALEVLRDDLAADVDFVAAVREQAGKLATSAHAHRGVARVYDCGTTDTGDLFVALERTEGPTLREVLEARGALDPPTALRVASQIGEALEALAHHGCIHGRLDADSVLMASDDEGREHATLVGVELSAGHRAMAARRRRAASVPPESTAQARERDDTKDTTDVQALGTLLRQMLTAEKAGAANGFRAATAVVPRTIDRIIATALEPRRQHRYPDISVMLNDMWGAQTAFAAPEPRPRSGKSAASAHSRTRRRRRHVALGIATVVLLAIASASLVWATLSDRIVPRFRAHTSPPATTAVPQAAMPAASLPSPPPAADAAATVVESGAATSSPTAEQAARPTTTPPPPAAVVRKQAPQSRSAVVDGHPRRSGESRPAEQRPPATQDSPRNDVGDGSAIIDWLLKDRR